ncbi:hypothetical protein GJAV_G00067610 [Gymnothorax javanicus]|nr:hypothetical protein GJAV_G00067610 [Gymnothorax javanicus]
MSALAVNDENCVEGCSRKPVGLEVICDIFTTAQPTGRPSILRQSQMENVPSKNVPKAKVCFQTPQRHPVTKKILSPSNPKMSGVLESPDVFASLSKQMALLEINGSPVLDKHKPGSHDLYEAEAPSPSDMGIQAKGGYQLDFDNLEAMNPFKSSSLVDNSPVKPQNLPKPPTTVQREEVDPFKASTLIPNSPMTAQMPAEPLVTVHDHIGDPFKSSSLVNNSPVKNPGPVEPLSTAESEPLAKMAASSDSQTAVDELVDPFRASNLMVNSPVKSQTSAEHEATMQSEAIDPFKSSNLMVNSPAKTSAPTELEATAQGEAQDVANGADLIVDTSLKTQMSTELQIVSESEVADPFKVSNLMVNSPAKAQVSAEPQDNVQSVGVDPFKSSNLMVNSPVKNQNLGDHEATMPSEAMDPFKVSTVMVNSPVKNRTSAEHEVTMPSEAVDPFKASTVMVNSPVKNQNLGDHEATMPSEAMDPFKVSTVMVNSPVKNQTSAEHEATMPSEAIDPFKASTVMVNSPVKNQNSGDHEVTMPSEAMDPFKASNLMVNSPMKTGLSVDLQSTGQDDVLTNDAKDVAEKVVVPLAPLDETLPFASSENSIADMSTEVRSTESTVIIDLKQAETSHSEGDFEPEADVSNNQDVPANGDSSQPVVTPPITTRGSYNFDFDNLDSINPFQTGGSKLQNSPMISKPQPIHCPAVALEAPKVIESKESILPKSSPTVQTAEVGTLKGSDRFDFSPFGMEPKVKSVPNCVQGEAAAQVCIGTETGPTNTPVLKDKAKGPSARVGYVAPFKEDVMSATEEKTLPEKGGLVSEARGCPPIPAPVSLPPRLQTPGPPASLAPADSSHSGVTPQEEEFVPGATFMAADFGQIDYLEQFGSSTFKESALRKQSLYLKFDPLVRDSPKKPSACTVDPQQIPLPPSFASRLEKPVDLVPVEQSRSGKADALFFLEEELPAPAAAPLVPPSILCSLGPSLPKPAGGEAAIIEVLMYSQSDLDAAIAKVKAEGKQKEEEWKAKYDRLTQDNEDMGKIMADFEATVSQVIADSKKQKAESLKELQKVAQEKEQVTMDLNSMERSFADLFKRLEKYKEVIEGYKKNEEILKKCAQDYLARIKQEEQRYQTLKVHAEEKIGLANDEIAQVRSKLKAETSALQAQVRREQLKVCSLEKRLEQKEKEAEELTKLCDELIANVQKR